MQTQRGTIAQRRDFRGPAHSTLPRRITYEMRSHYREVHPGMWDDPDRKGPLYEKVGLNVEGEVVDGLVSTLRELLSEAIAAMPLVEQAAENSDAGVPWVNNMPQFPAREATAKVRAFLDAYAAVVDTAKEDEARASGASDADIAAMRELGVL